MKLWKPGEKITAAGLNAMQENRRERKSLDSFPIAVPLNTEVMLPDEKMYSWDQTGYYTVRGEDWKANINIYDMKYFSFYYPGDTFCFFNNEKYVMNKGIYEFLSYDRNEKNGQTTRSKVIINVRESTY
jgi:hypothetical protein